MPDSGMNDSLAFVGCFHNGTDGICDTLVMTAAGHSGRSQSTWHHVESSQIIALYMCKLLNLKIITSFYQYV